MQNEGNIMATQHYDYKIVNKAKGHNLIAKVAYNSRHKVYDEEEQKMKYPHTATSDHVDTVMLLPKKAPKKYNNPSVLWNEVKQREPKRQAKNMIIGVPHELIKRTGTGPLDYDFSIGKKIILDHLNREFVSKGYFCQVDFHLSYNKKGEPNFHAHVLLSERQMINGKWTEAKSHKIYLDKNNKIIEPIPSPKLLFGKLVYDKDNNLVMEPGYKILQYNNDGKPLLDKRGYPVTTDIRVPIISKRKDGKKEWKERKRSNTNVDDKGNLKRFRTAWQDIQNEYFKKYNILDQIGNILQVDHRPFREKYADIPPELRPEPTKRAPRGILNQSIIEYNKAVMERRKLITLAKDKVNKIRIKKSAVNAIQNRILKEEDNFIKTLNPQKLYVDRWNNFYNDMISKVKSQETDIMIMLQQSLKNNRNQQTNMDKNSDEAKRLRRHEIVMVDLQNKILASRKKDTINVKTMAKASFNRLTPSEKISYIRSSVGTHTANIFARVLNRQDENANAVNDRDVFVYFPKSDDENDKIIKQSCYKIAKISDVSDLINTSIIKWNIDDGEAPPIEIVQAINVLHTATDYYHSKLTNKDWRILEIINPKNYDSPDKINLDYNAVKSKHNDLPKTDVVVTKPTQEFWKNNKDRYLQAVSIYTDTQHKILDYSETTQAYINEERNNNQIAIIKLVADKIGDTEKQNIIRDIRRKTPDISDSDAVIKYLKQYSKKLQAFSSLYGYQSEYENYKKWSVIAKNYYGLGHPEKVVRDGGRDRSMDRN